LINIIQFNSFCRYKYIQPIFLEFKNYFFLNYFESKIEIGKIYITIVMLIGFIQNKAWSINYENLDLKLKTHSKIEKHQVTRTCLNDEILKVV